MGNDDDINPGFDRYRGYADPEIKTGKADGLVFRSVVGWTKEGGSVQLDLTYPLHRIAFGNIDVCLQVQFVNRLAESLLNCRQRNETLRLGSAIIR